EVNGCIRLFGAGTQQGQPRGGFSRHAGDEDVIARARARAREIAVVLDPTADLNGNGEGTAHRIAADEYDVVSLGQLEQSFREPVQPPLVGMRQRERQRHPRRFRTHRGEIAQVHGERAIADVLRCRLLEKMYALRDRIHREHELAVRAHVQYSRIIANAEHDIAARLATRKVLCNDVEFAEAHFLGCRLWLERIVESRRQHPLPCARGRAKGGLSYRSAARISRAARSSTAFTYLCASVAPNRLHKSTASLITTR